MEETKEIFLLKKQEENERNPISYFLLHNKQCVDDFYFIPLSCSVRLCSVKTWY